MSLPTGIEIQRLDGAYGAGVMCEVKAKSTVSEVAYGVGLFIVDVVGASGGTGGGTGVGSIHYTTIM